MQPLVAAIQSLAMQHFIDFRCAQAAYAIAPFPRGAKPQRVGAAAKEAWPVPRRERGRLVEKEQLGPAAAAHYGATPAPEFADAGNPGLGGPALAQQRLRCWVVNDAAIAGEQSAMPRRDDFS